MPRISVIIPMYNVERYVKDCLQSVLRQTMSDLEVLVVDDASLDGSRGIVDEIAAHDEHVRIISHESNRGRHLARKTGVAAAQGEYALFLDADDLLVDETVIERLVVAIEEKPADVLRFGLEAMAVEGIKDEAADSFARWSNRPWPDASGREIARLAFDELGGYQIAWHVDHRLYRMSTLKRAFDAMSDERLERAEDAYEYFVVSYFAQTERTRCDIMGYLYRMGAGVTSARALSVERFLRESREVRESYEAAMEFAHAMQDEAYLRFAVGLKHKLLETASNDWHERVPAEDKLDAAQQYAEIVGASEAAYDLWRLVRDQAYALYYVGKQPDTDDEYHLLHRIADSLGPLVANDEEGRRARNMREQAYGNITEMRRGQELRAHAEQPIRVFVTTHKPVDVPTAHMLQPVQVGWREGQRRFVDTFHDDEGENIAERNPMYCELTTQYWAWKNVQADYVGFCHYRRYFNFSGERFEENEYGEIMDSYIDEPTCARYGLDDESIRRAVEGYDLITTPIQDVREMPGGANTPFEQYAAAPKLHIEDLERAALITRELHPDYAEDLVAFLDGHESCFCNMFIMRWELFDRYCAWLFPILDAFLERSDLSRYSKEALRTPGHLAERLLNVWLIHERRVNSALRTKELQCVHFEHPDPAYPVHPAADQIAMARTFPVVPIVLAADDAYVPMLTTTIWSLLQNASPERFYDIVVFERGITGQHQQEMRALVGSLPNASLRFFNVARTIAGFDLKTNNAHISLETYYRFLIQDVLSDYDKVLYLDSDLIIEGDVAELFDVELGDALLAAAPDIDFAGNLNMPDGVRLRYATGTLGLADPYAYFQAGVLVLNTAELRKLHTAREWLDIACSVDYLYDDQDILNAECQGRVVTLPRAWNVMHDCAARVANVFSFAPADDFDAYMASRTAPRIIHYAGFEKPWTNPDCDFAARYWHYARQTPFYELLVKRLAEGVVPAQAVDALHEHEKAVREDSPLRRIIDPIAPYGTARREVLKALGRAVQGKK